jgi:mannose-1-phosphate guanylyltransferase
MFRASTYIRQLKQFAPGIFDACEKAYAHASEDLGFVRLDETLFKASPATSIDYAIMEHTPAPCVRIDVRFSEMKNKPFRGRRENMNATIQ